MQVRRMANTNKRYELELKNRWSVQSQKKAGQLQVSIRSITQEKELSQAGSDSLKRNANVKQDFAASGPNETWCTDFTYRIWRMDQKGITAVLQIYRINPIWQKGLMQIWLYRFYRPHLKTNLCRKDSSCIVISVPNTRQELSRNFVRRRTSHKM